MFFWVFSIKWSVLLNVSFNQFNFFFSFTKIVFDNVSLITCNLINLKTLLKSKNQMLTDVQHFFNYVRQGTFSKFSWLIFTLNPCFYSPKKSFITKYLVYCACNYRLITLTKTIFKTS